MRNVIQTVVILLLIGASAGCRTARSLTATPGERFDQTREIACHNCYEPAYAKPLTEAFRYTRHIEIDIYPAARTKGHDLRWYVSHWSGGNKNNCSGPDPRGNDLAACLADIRGWMASNDTAAPLTIYVDLKRGWGEHTPARLDSLFLKELPGLIFTPDSLRFRAGTFLQRSRSLRTAVAEDGWPAVGEMRGRALVVLTAGLDTPLGDAASPGNPGLNKYLVQRKSSAVAFVAPLISDTTHVVSVPFGIDARQRGEIVFFNTGAGHLLPRLMPRVRQVGGILRFYEEFERPVGQLCSLHSVGVQRIARKKIRADRLNCAKVR